MSTHLGIGKLILFPSKHSCSHAVSCELMLSHRTINFLPSNGSDWLHTGIAFHSILVTTEGYICRYLKSKPIITLGNKEWSWYIEWNIPYTSFWYWFVLIVSSHLIFICLWFIEYILIVRFRIEPETLGQPTITHRPRLKRTNMILLDVHTYIHVNLPFQLYCALNIESHINWRQT